MDIKEAHERKKALQQAIKVLVQEFNEKTGMHVQSIDLIYISVGTMFSTDDKLLNHVEAEIRL